MTDCKLIFGLNHQGNGNVTLTITGGPAAAMPDVVAENPSGNRTYGTYNQYASPPCWTLTLAPGDYLVRLDLDANQWFSGQVPVSASAAVNFVYRGSQSGDTTVAWNTTTAVGRGDPKDPWPPPVAPYTTLSSDSFRWHDGTLKTASDALPKDLQLDFDVAAGAR